MSFFAYFANNMPEFLQNLLRHVQIVVISVAAGTVISIPLGVYLTRHKRLATVVLAVAGTVQTIPGLVMLGFALMVFGIGFLPALAVLTVYSVLPILRNTYTGICLVDAGCREAGRGIGMTDIQVLLKVELPLAAPSIMSGIRISTVYTVSWATLAGMIGAGGLGDLIWTGLSTYNTNYLLAGAIPSAILAFTFSGLLGLLQRLMTPRGMRRRGT